MMNARVYRPGRELAGALEELRRKAGTQFCPRCVDAAVAVAVRDVTVPRRSRPSAERGYSSRLLPVPTVLVTGGVVTVEPDSVLPGVVVVVTVCCGGWTFVPWS